MSSLLLWEHLGKVSSTFLSGLQRSTLVRDSSWLCFSWPPGAVAEWWNVHRYLLVTLLGVWVESNQHPVFPLPSQQCPTDNITILLLTSTLPGQKWGHICGAHICAGVYCLWATACNLYNLIKIRRNDQFHEAKLSVKFSLRGIYSQLQKHGVKLEFFNFCLNKLAPGPNL